MATQLRRTFFQGDDDDQQAGRGNKWAANRPRREGFREKEDGYRQRGFREREEGYVQRNHRERDGYRQGGYQNRNDGHNMNQFEHSRATRGRHQKQEMGHERQYNQFDQQSGMMDKIKLEPGFPFTKKLIEVEPLTQEKQAENEQLRKEARVVIKNNNTDAQIDYQQNVEVFGQAVQSQWVQSGFTSPTPIQAQTWPTLLQGANMIGISQTGSGKTLAYMLPIFKHVTAQPYWKKVQGPLAVVLAPTRELVNQIYKVSRQFGREEGIHVCQVYGGASKVRQAEEMARRCDVLIATPGRLLDFMQEGVVQLDKTTMVVLDEADRMLDMGFEEQLQEAMQAIRTDKQTLMFSATWPKEIQRFANNYIKDYCHVQIGDQQLTVNTNITQLVDFVPDRSKGTRLVQYLDTLDLDNNKALLFVSKKVRCDDLVKFLYGKGVKATQLHGNMTQSARDSALYKFRQGYFHVLVATDIAARGLDVKDIKYVINIDMPQNIDDYVHRIGRTGRAGQKGFALTFFSDSDLSMASALTQFLLDSRAKVDPALMSFKNIRKTREHVFRRNLLQQYSQEGENMLVEIKEAMKEQ